MLDALRDSFWWKHYLRHISHARKVTGSSFHGVRKKVVCSQVVKLYFMMKLCLEDHIVHLLVVQIIVIQKSVKFTRNLLAIGIMQSVRPGENKTSGIMLLFAFI